MSNISRPDILMSRHTHMHKTSARLTKNKKRGVQINESKSERREFTTDTKEIQRIVRAYYNYRPTNWTTWKKGINSLENII